MADIMTVRQFTSNLRNLKTGQEIVLVDGNRRKIMACFEVKEAPELIEKRITRIFRK